MTRAYFRRQRRAMAQKVAALLLFSVAPVAVADPAPLALQPIVSPTAFLATAVQTRPPSNVPSQRRPSAEPGVADPEGAAAVAQTESPDDASSQRQQLDATETTGPDGATDINDLMRELLDYRTEALNDRAKTVDWWLAATAIFLTLTAIFLALLGIGAGAAGYISFNRFREIEAEARKILRLSRNYAEEARRLVDQTKGPRKNRFRFCYMGAMV